MRILLIAALSFFPFVAQAESLLFEYEIANSGALANVELHIHPDELSALVGPSGSGKTTAIQLLGPILQPTGGKFTVIVSDEPNGRFGEFNISSGLEFAKMPKRRNPDGQGDRTKGRRFLG